MLQVTTGQGVGSLITLLVISACFYLINKGAEKRQSTAGVFSSGNDGSAAWDELSNARRLLPVRTTPEESGHGMDTALASLLEQYGMQAVLTSLIEQHSLQTSAAGFTNTSHPSSAHVTGALTCIETVWPGSAQLPEPEHIARALSEDTAHVETETSDHAGSSEEAHSPTSDATHGSGSSHGSGAVECKEHEGHHSHQHDALLFLFNIILIGTGLLHINAVFPKLQFTIMLFVLGLVVSLFLEGLDLKCQTGIVGKSYIMWMNIDPHLLLFTMLPALLAGDAMTIDTSVAKRVSLQCLYLAGPGVVISAGVAALFLKYYFDWSFLLSLVTSSILCATDPVAVVALLKELGASPVLTVQIQGESLLNDGTAIVLYTVAYRMLSGEEYDTGKVIMFLVKTALMACAVGCFMGYIFFSWMRFANDRFKHAAGVIQILLTLSCAYWSFIMAEGVLEMSGVLATVCSSLVLAHHMWPHLVSRETLQNFWHTLEELMNIIIFLLAGSLCGQVMVHIEFIDYVHLIVIYIFLTVGRAALIFGSRPLLKFLSFDRVPVTISDAAVMTWGGLRGAVGLALAIQVRRDRAEDVEGVPQIDDETSQRVLFFVSGVAFLTTTINASTCPLLVKALGITALPRTRYQLLEKFADKLVGLSDEVQHPKKVTESLHHMLHHVKEDIKAKTEQHLGHKIRERVIKRAHSRRLGAESNEICQSFIAAQKLFEKIPDEDKVILDHPNWKLSDLNMDDQKMVNLVGMATPEKEMCKTIVRTFMRMVQSHYQQQITQGELRPGSKEADLLFTSVRYCLSPISMDLKDFEYLYHSITDADVIEGNMELIDEEKDLSEDLRAAHSRHGKSSVLPANIFNSQDTTHTGGHSGLASAAMHRHFMHLPDITRGGCWNTLDKVVRSQEFSLICIGFILLNGVCVVIDEMARTEANQHDLIWLLMEWFFSIVFLVEATLKIVHHPKSYFKDVWNQFDFFLVVIGIAGGILSTVEYMKAEEERGDSSALSAASRASRTIRIAKILRSMRLLRIFLLVHAMFSRDKYLSQDLALNMLKLQTLNSFVQAHISAQKQIKKFFVGKDIVEDVEIARCLLQSMTSVYKALISIVSVDRVMAKEHGKKLLNELQVKKETKRIAEELEEFVNEAEESGAITAQEAHSILHPMHETLANCMDFISLIDDGFVSKDVDQMIHEEYIEDKEEVIQNAEGTNGEVNKVVDDPEGEEEDTFTTV